MKTYYIKYLVLFFFFMAYVLIPLPYALSQVMIVPGNGILIPIGPAGPLLPVPLLLPFQITGLSNRFGNSPSPNGPALGISSASGGYAGGALQGNGNPGLVYAGTLASPSYPIGNPGLMGGLQMTTAPGPMDGYGLMNEYEMMGAPGPMGVPGPMGGPGQMADPGPMGGPWMVNNLMGPAITGTAPPPVPIPAPTTIAVSTTLTAPVIVDTIIPTAGNAVAPLPIVDTIPPPTILLDTIPPFVLVDTVPPPVVDILPPSLPPVATSFPAPTIPPLAANQRPYPMQYNYMNLGSFGVYAPTDPVNFALVNSFFPNGIFTGPQTVVTENVTTVTTPIVTSTIYHPSPTPGVADLNSIQYTPVSSLPLNNMIASPYVTIYGPGGILLSGPGLF